MHRPARSAVIAVLATAALGIASTTALADTVNGPVTVTVKCENCQIAGGSIFNADRSNIVDSGDDDDGTASGELPGELPGVPPGAVETTVTINVFGGPGLRLEGQTENIRFPFLIGPNGHGVGLAVRESSSKTV